MKYKVGQVFFWCSAEVETGKISLEEYVVRTIRGGYVHAIWKNSLTWGKLSSKHGHIGWLKNIPAWCRHKWRIDAGAILKRPDELATTKLAAIRHAIKTLCTGDFENDEAFKSASRTLKSMETKHKPKRKPPKQQP